MQKECGLYCENGKKLDDINESRKKAHETNNNISIHMATMQVEISNISKGQDEIKTMLKEYMKSTNKELDNKVNWSEFKWALGGLCGVALVIGGIFATLIYTKVDSVQVDINQFEYAN